MGMLSVFAKCLAGNNFPVYFYILGWVGLKFIYGWGRSKTKNGEELKT